MSNAHAWAEAAERLAALWPASSEAARLAKVAAGSAACAEPGDTSDEAHYLPERCAREAARTIAREAGDAARSSWTEGDYDSASWAECVERAALRFLGNDARESEGSRMWGSQFRDPVVERPR